MVFFAISEPMAGSVIPGVLVHTRVVKIANWPDHTSSLKRRAVVDPVIKFPDMNEPHSTGHPVIDKLKAMLAGGGPQMREGYTPFKGTRNWRAS